MPVLQPDLPKQMELDHLQDYQPTMADIPPRQNGKYNPLFPSKEQGRVYNVCSLVFDKIYMLFWC